MNLGKAVLFSLVTWLTLVSHPQSAFAYTISGQVVCEQPPGGTTTLIPGGAVIQAFEVDPVPGGSYVASFLESKKIGELDHNGHWKLEIGQPLDSGFEAGDPDLLFKLVQFGTNVVYQEIYADTHWNVGDGATITLPALSLDAAVCDVASAWQWPAPDATDPSHPGQPNDSYFVFTRIGLIEMKKLDARGSNHNASGYAHPRTRDRHDPGPVFTGPNSDQPFGGTLSLVGWFGKQANVDRYKLQYQCDGTGPWIDIRTPLPNSWYNRSPINDSTKWHWVTESMGPFSDTDVSGSTIDNVYKVPYVEREVPWAWMNRIGFFDTRLAGDERCEIRLIGYQRVNGGLREIVNLGDPNYGSIYVLIDNAPPTVAILDVKRNGSKTEACDVVKLGFNAHFPGIATPDHLTVDFRVWDPPGHLRSYHLAARYGRRCQTSPPPQASASYPAGASRWEGKQDPYTATYAGSAYGEDGRTDCRMPAFAKPGLLPPLPSCAYELLLAVSKRTTNGSRLIYPHVEDNWHLTIERINSLILNP